MKIGIKPKALLISIAVGFGLTFLTYYFTTAVPPGATLPVYIEGGSTTRSNVSIRDTPEDNAEVDFLIQVDHSLPKFGFAVAGGSLVTVIILWRDRARNKPWTKAHVQR